MFVSKIRLSKKKYADDEISNWKQTTKNAFFVDEKLHVMMKYGIDEDWKKLWFFFYGFKKMTVLWDHPYVGWAKKNHRVMCHSLDLLLWNEKRHGDESNEMKKCTFSKRACMKIIRDERLILQNAETVWRMIFILRLITFC